MLRGQCARELLAYLDSHVDDTIARKGSLPSLALRAAADILVVDTHSLWSCVRWYFAVFSATVESGRSLNLLYYF
jgi:hypothetical protein